MQLLHSLKAFKPYRTLQFRRANIVIIMLDFIKATTSEPELISRLQRYAQDNLQPHKSQNRNYICYSNGTGRFRFEFRKVVKDGQILGFREVELCFSPHYYFNDDLHNGNDFTPSDCIATIIKIMQVLDISEQEMRDFRLTNLEHGLNLNPDIDIKNLITGIIYTKKTKFRPNKGDYSIISDSTKYKEIKAYAKGIQFSDNPEYSIPFDCFRFEVRSKQHKAIKRLGIATLADLTNMDKYTALYQSLITEWDNILVINDEVNTKENTKTYWDNILANNHRNTFVKTKEKYYKNQPLKINLHLQVKGKIIDKINDFQKCANSTHRTPINTGNLDFENVPGLLINLESAHYSINNTLNIDKKSGVKNEEKKPRCIITGLDISMQKKGSRFLNFKGLIHYFNNEPKTYQMIRDEFWSLRMENTDLRSEMYYLAKNIRNRNPRNNRKRFERKTYPRYQLSLDL